MQPSALMHWDYESTSATELEPETILPAQFFSPLRVDASLLPEKRLMLTVLEDAVVTFRKHAGAHGRRPRRLFSDVEEWFASDDTAWPFSFVSICHVVGFDVSSIRSSLARWRQGPRVRDGGTAVRFPSRGTTGDRHAVTERRLSA